MGWWLVELEGGKVEQVANDPADWHPDAVRSVAIEEPINLKTHCWDWGAGEIVLRATPQQARDEQWDAAKKYRDDDRYFWPIPVVDAVPDEVILVQCDAKSREKVSDLAQAATWATMRGEALSITFTDGANVPFTVDAQQTIAIKAAVTLNDARCHMASQVLRADLDEAVAAGATAADIFAIDIVARFEEILAAGELLQETES